MQSNKKKEINVFGEPAISANASVNIEDYHKFIESAEANYAVAYFTAHSSYKLYFSVNTYSNNVKNPKLKVNQNGEALLYLNTDDLEKMSDLEKEESTIYFNNLNKLKKSDLKYYRKGRIVDLRIYDLVEADDEFEIFVVSRNQEKRKNGKRVGKKFNFIKAEGEAVDMHYNYRTNVKTENSYSSLKDGDYIKSRNNRSHNDLNKSSGR